MDLNFLKGDKQKRAFLSFIIMFVAMLLLKAYVVQLIYNTLAPKLIKNAGNDVRDFKPLTYPEAILMCILFKFLFR